MNILYLTDTGSIIGGGEISLLNLCSHLDKIKFNPFAIVPCEGDFAKKMNALGVTVITLGWKKVKNPLNIFATVRTIKKVACLLQDNKIDAVHCNSTGAITFFGALAAKRANVPFLWHVRVTEPGYLLDCILAFLSKRIVVISEAVSRRFWWLPVRKKIVVIHNGVNIEKFNCLGREPVKTSLGCSEDDCVIGTVGRYVPWKGYHLFLRAAKLIVQKFPKAKFVIVGIDYSEGNKYVQHLLSLIDTLGIKENVQLLDRREDIPSVMASFDIFVIPSLGEPFGRVIIEAMALKRPVVGFLAGGVPEIVEDKKSGFLVPLKDYALMAEKILQLIGDASLRERMGENGRSRVSTMFDIRVHAKRIEELYCTIRNQ